MNIAHHVARARHFFPDKPAILFETRTYTYRELDETTNRLANGLRALGIRRGDRVSLFLPNIPAFALAYLATLRIGAVAVSINSLFKTDEVRYIVNDSDSVALFTTADLYPQLDRAGMPGLKQVIIAEGQVGGEIQLDDLVAKGASTFQAEDMDREENAALLYTSGTTGNPKGVILTHGNIISNIYATNHHAGMRPDDRLMLFLPLFHCFGQNFIMNAAFNVGATLLLHRRFDMERTVDSIQRDGATMFFAVPTIYIYLLGNPNYDLSSIRYWFSAAAAMPHEIALQWLDRTGKPINEGYGLTECSPFAAYNHDFRYKPATVGTPIENVEMKIFNEDDQEVPVGEMGEIVIRGPNVMKGYFGKEKDSAAALRSGWLHSGDIGYQDDEGYFHIADRVKDMINAAGFKVYPVEVENVLYKHPAIQEAAVYGVPDPVKGEAVEAAIVLRAGAQATPEEIIEFCRSRIAVFKAPRAVHLVPQLPKSATGKILKRILRDRGN